MNLEDKSAQINSFWKWFVDNEKRIRDLLDDNAVGDRDPFIQDMDNQILEFGMFTWEIGEGIAKPFFLTVSPNGNKELMDQGKLIMKSAPDLPDWEFNYAKPAKDWDFTFRLFDDNMIERNLNASEWKFILGQAPGNKVKVTIEAPNIVGLDYDTQLAAGDLVVTNMLGEECKINHVGKIEIMNDLNSQDKAAGFSIMRLKQEFEIFLK
jgi:hypothetical protein